MDNLTKEVKKQIDIKAYRCSQKFRELWNIPDEPIKDIYSLAETKEFLFLRFPNNYLMSGIFLEKKDRDNRKYKCIYINTKDPYGRQNFSIVHELYHVYFEKNPNGICMANKLNKDPVEFAAERFASYILIPRNILTDILKKRHSRNISIYELFDMQKLFSVSFQALVYAISDLESRAKYKRYVPINIKTFFKYYRSQYWDELEQATKKHDKTNFLNSSRSEYEFPEDFKNNLLINLKNKRVDEENVREMFDFFGEEIVK